MGDLKPHELYCDGTRFVSTKFSFRIDLVGVLIK